ncbi:hypothetical protein HOK51_03290 [Candidatus Woesearchaeota archaeon]|jgi:hypothetical protein|nr:hypothetical protein [Candidatus Woesearchaeota archaeon]MBT6518844.1 hypothetical protein [Candidatus Woesearchaeota archaeon]MBT7367983.1 hypothetical protein [Candidatus Woesearchaeota archaeon]
MARLKTDTFDISEVCDVIIEILKLKKVEEINLEFFSLSDDDEITEKISVNELKEKIKEIYDEDDYGRFEVKELGILFEFSQSDLIFNYSAELEHELVEKIKQVFDV